MENEENKDINRDPEIQIKPFDKYLSARIFHPLKRGVGGLRQLLTGVKRYSYQTSSKTEKELSTGEEPICPPK